VKKLLVGLIGAGIGRSLSPAMHEAEARTQGLALHYQLIDLDASGRDASALPMLLDAARVMGFAGLNITFPCKQAIVPLLDGLSDEARAMNAVNTVVLRDGKAIGHNTDGSGWVRGFTAAMPQADMRCVVLLGAGGAGSAIAHAALGRLNMGVLRIVDAELAKAQSLAAHLAARFGVQRVAAFADIEAAMQGSTGLIHATPTGMHKLPGLPLPDYSLNHQPWVAEVVYFPLHTELLQTARAKGCAVVDGGGMAVGQAAGAFALFTGIEPDAQRMERHFRALVQRD
jgi:shikimate dehydrogenase